MQLVKWNPMRDMLSFNNRADRIFNDFFYPSRGMQLSKDSSWNPRVDIYEDENAIVLTAELPGVEKEDLYVDTKGKLVTLGGERKSDEKITDEHSYRRERNYGKFERSFNLPFEINTEKVTATFNNGILKLEIPKPEEETTSKVTIQ